MWVSPKTNWVNTDKFNVSDYNRIKNNLDHLRTMSLVLYATYPYTAMGSDKVYTDYYYADEINLFETNLASINTNTFPQSIGTTKTFYPNQTFIDYVELNRLESGMLMVYNVLYGQTNGRRKLSFTLGIRRAV